jgi:hypothetical protein
VLAPERVRVPEDWLTRLPVPEIIPAYDPVPVTVKVAVPKVMLPVPERFPIVLLKLLRSRVAPLPIETLVFVGRTPAAPDCRIPALIVVLPV